MKKKFKLVILAVFALLTLVPIYITRAASLSEKLKGQILLQVESHGEAWYVNPKDGKKYYMPDGDQA